MRAIIKRPYICATAPAIKIASAVASPPPYAVMYSMADDDIAMPMSIMIRALSIFLTSNLYTHSSNLIAKCKGYFIAIFSLELTLVFPYYNGMKLKEWRKKRKLSQRELAEKFEAYARDLKPGEAPKKLCQTTLGYWERGTLPRNGWLAVIMAYTKNQVTANDFVSDGA
jgi:hypothetical protein